MSMIEEALRRIQDPTVAKSQAGQTAEPKTGSAPKKAPEPHSWPAAPVSSASSPAAASNVNPMAAVGLLVLATGILLVAGTLIWVSRSMHARPEQTTGRSDGAASPVLELTPPPPPALPDPIAMSQPKDTSGFPWVHVRPLKAKEFVLSGIVEGGEPYAVINDLIVGVGEAVGGATLAGIQNGAVTLRRSSGQEIVLRIEQ